MFPHPVSVVHEAGRVYLGPSGWPEFVAAERISCFDIGLFVLMRPSRFVMRLYGNNGFEKPMPLRSVVTTPISDPFVLSAPAYVQSPPRAEMHRGATAPADPVPNPDPPAEDVKMPAPPHAPHAGRPSQSSPSSPSTAAAAADVPVPPRVQGMDH